MQRDPLSCLNRNHFYGCHPFDLRSYFEGELFFEKFDPRYLINPAKPEILPPKPPLRQRVLGRILQNRFRNPPDMISRFEALRFSDGS